MDAAQALADLTEISSQIQAAVIFDGEGRILASTLADGGDAEEAARAARELLEVAGSIRHEGGPQLTQLEAALPDGSVFVVRDRGNTVVAATTPEPTVGLVFYDLKSCLRALSAEQESGPATTEGDAAA
jgi:predicted regulator of Ras-like GTPase activity (Roadblock/LC7/MglB family)